MIRRDAEAQANDAPTRALIDAASRSQRPRCGDYETSYLWLSEDAQDRRLAALMCAGCAVLTECDEVGRHERFGTWAGKDRTVRPPGKKAA
jgi:Transcription factor WhiB